MPTLRPEGSRARFLYLDFFRPATLYWPARTYPELFALVGTNVPDLRGLFLRGHGGNSAALGQTQGDAIRNITGSLGRLPSAIGGDATGPFYTSRNANDGGLYPSNTARYVDMDISRVVPTASENRPVNRAVRYLIRVRQ